MSPKGAVFAALVVLAGSSQAPASAQRWPWSSGQASPVRVDARLGPAGGRLALHLGGATLARPAIRASGTRRYTPRLWVPGRYETVARRVWVPGRIERIWIEPVFEQRRPYGACNTAIRVLVRDGFWRHVRHAGHYEIRHVRVWRPGRWSRPY